MPWLSIALNKWTWIAIAFGCVAAWGAVQTGRLGLCQSRLDAAVTANAALRKEIALQNAAVDRLKAESDAKVKEAQEGIAAARQGTASARTEAARLRALSLQPSAPRPPMPPACPPSPADRAVTAIRQGL